MALETPDEIDKFVGQRILTARKIAGISQGDLAATIDVTFQQVQKYENGTNRVSAGVLVVFARKLGVPVWWFFGDTPGEEPSEISGVHDFLTKPHAVTVAAAYNKLTDVDRMLIATLSVRLSDGGAA